MKWNLVEPSFGDMIRVKLGEIYHYGIYVSDGEIIQFGPPPSQRLTKKDSEIEVIATDIDAFLIGGFLEVCEFDKKEQKKNRTPEQIVEFARSKLGTRGYNILYNNCEHFANECVSGEHRSSQADAVRSLFRALPVADVYIARIPDGRIRTVVPEARNREISETSNERVKREKYYVWRLLEYALERSFGMRMKKLEFECLASGRWTTPSAEISLSHSGAFVAVAVSRAPIGIDIEKISEPRSERFADRALTEEECVKFRSLGEEARAEYLISLWTAKEATFKSLHLDAFCPRDIAADASKLRSGRISDGEDDYIWTVATSTPERVRVYENVDLSKL